MAGAKLNVDFAYLEIRDRKQLLILFLPRQEAADLAKICIIFKTDEAILSEIAGKSNGWRKIGLSVGSEAYIDDRIDDKFPLLVAHANDRSNFEAPGGRRKPRQFIAEFEVDSIEEASLGGVRNDK